MSTTEDNTTALPPSPEPVPVAPHRSEGPPTPTLSRFYRNQLTRSSVRTPKLAVKGGNFAKVVRVLSGSMVVATVMLGRYPYRITVKLDGVDADRVRDEDGEDADSVKARDQLSFLVQNQLVYLDVKRLDLRRNHLAVLYLLDGENPNFTVSVNDKLVEGGYAREFTPRPRHTTTDGESGAITTEGGVNDEDN